MYIFFLESMYKNRKMEKTIIKFDDIKIPKQKLHQHRRPILIKIVDTNKIVVSNKVSFGKKGFKYFIGYNDINKINPLCIFLPKMSAFGGDFDETKYISFLIKDDKLYLKNAIKLGEKKLKLVSKKNLIVNQFTMKSI